MPKEAGQSLLIFARSCLPTWTVEDMAGSCANSRTLQRVLLDYWRQLACQLH